MKMKNDQILFLIMGFIFYIKYCTCSNPPETKLQASFFLELNIDDIVRFQKVEQAGLKYIKNVWSFLDKVKHLTPDVIFDASTDFTMNLVILEAQIKSISEKMLQKAKILIDSQNLTPENNEQWLLEASSYFAFSLFSHEVEVVKKELDVLMTKHSPSNRRCFD